MLQHRQDLVFAAVGFFQSLLGPLEVGDDRCDPADAVGLLFRIEEEELLSRETVRFALDRRDLLAALDLAGVEDAHAIGAEVVGVLAGQEVVFRLALHPLGWLVRVTHTGPVREQVVSLGVFDVEDRRPVVHAGAQALLAIGQRLFRLSALGDVDHDAQGQYRATVRVEGESAVRLHPAGGAVRPN
jgi:hypothetical protein